eukprot:8876287-Lingulodinium_polyedra.AAC.1
MMVMRMMVLMIMMMMVVIMMMMIMVMVMVMVFFDGRPVTTTARTGKRQPNGSFQRQCGRRPVLACQRYIC